MNNKLVEKSVSKIKNHYMRMLLLVPLLFLNFCFGQTKEEILEEGKLLYRLEKASWYGTDVLLESFPHKMDVGGYLSYVNEKNQVVNIFWKRNEPSHILVRFEFDSLPQKNPIRIDTLNHIATQKEKDLIAIRLDANQRISKNEDSFFTFYKNTSFNLIPLIHKGEKKVFILTGPKGSNVVIIGNDYLLTYNKKNKLVQKEKLHNSMLQYPWKSDEGITFTFHSHILSDLITSTDICTLLLYKDFVEWKQHYVISEKYVSIFDLEKEILAVMTKEAWEKISGNKKEKE